MAKSPGYVIFWAGKNSRVITIPEARKILNLVGPRSNKFSRTFQTKRAAQNFLKRSNKTNPDTIKVKAYKPPTRAESAELVNLWHLSKVHSNSRYERMLWVSKWYAKEHPEKTSTWAYKALDRQLSNPLTKAETKRTRAEAKIHKRIGRTAKQKSYYKGMAAGMEDIAEQYGTNPPRDKWKYRGPDFTVVKNFETNTYGFEPHTQKALNFKRHLISAGISAGDLQNMNAATVDALIRYSKRKGLTSTVYEGGAVNPVMPAINPVKVRKLPGRKKWRVYDQGRVTAEATTKAKAEAQARLLRGIAHGMIPHARQNRPIKRALARKLQGAKRRPEMYRGFSLYKDALGVNVFYQGRTVGEYQNITQARRAVDTMLSVSHARPNPGAVEIYERVKEIVAVKGPGHKCDRKCKEAGHTYIHRFVSRKPAHILGNADGSLTIETKKK